MTPSTEELKLQLAVLSVHDGAELAYFLLHSLDDEEEAVNWEAAWAAEIHKRAKDIANGTFKGIPAEEVFADLRKKYT